jgi:hypothetical protein
MTGPETRIYKKIKKAIETNYKNSLVLKIHGNMFQNRGIYDLIICIPVRAFKVRLGLYVGIEVKVPGKHPTDIQDEMLRKAKQAGAIAGCAHNVEEALAIVEDGLNELRRQRNEVLPHLLKSRGVQRNKNRENMSCISRRKLSRKSNRSL